MPGSSNFKVFNEDLQNAETDNEYATETQRISGLVSGIAKTKMHNKLFRQTSVMTAALAQFMAEEGQVVSDADLAALVSVIRDTFATTGDLTAHLADYVRQPGFAPTTGSANTYAVSTTPPLPALADGVSIYLDVQVANTGASTLNWSGKGARAIVDGKGNALTAGKLPLNGLIGVRFNASAAGGVGNFQLLGEGGEYGTAEQAQVLEGYTVGRDDGVKSGTIPTLGVVSAIAQDVSGTSIRMRPPMGYSTGTASTLVVASDADYVPENFLVTKNMFGKQGSIPVLNPDLADSYPGGPLAYNGFGDGLTYALLQVQNHAYLNGINWIRSAQPHLLPVNIVKDKTIMGTAGTATIQSLGGYAPGDIIPFHKAGIAAISTPVWEHIAAYNIALFAYGGPKVDALGNVIYLNGTPYRFAKLNGTTGAVMWETTASISDDPWDVDTNGDVYQLDGAYTGSAIKLRKFNGSTGALVWEVASPAFTRYGSTGAVLAGAGTNVYVFGGNDSVRGYSKSTGAIAVVETQIGNPAYGLYISKSSGDLFVHVGLNNAAASAWRRYGNASLNLVTTFTYAGGTWVKLLGLIGDVIYYHESLNTSETYVVFFKRNQGEVVTSRYGPYVDRQPAMSTDNGINLALIIAGASGTDIIIIDHATRGIFITNVGLQGILNPKWVGPNNEIINYTASTKKLSKYSPFGVLVR